MEATATTHRIIAAPWQLEAAKNGRLGAVIMPLVPEPKQSSDGTWNYRETWWGADGPHPDYLDEVIPYEVGDRLYLAEEWDEAIGQMGESFEYPTKRQHPLWTDQWQPAATMPPEAAQYWLEVTGVRVVQCKDVSLKEIWNAAHPEYPWSPERWVVVMEVESVKKSA